MKIRNCIVTIKQTILERGGRAAQLARAGHRTAQKILSSDREQRLTIETVRKILRQHKIACTEISARQFTAVEKRQINAADLVLTIGGDGTALATSHYIRRGVMLGVNSAPGDSVGYFCHTHRGNFAERFADVLAGRWEPAKLTRLGVTLDGKNLPELALNDVLIAHDCPAATSRYLLEIGEHYEEHRSSGLWISTAAGSTAGIRSAGGKVMPLGSQRLQYLVRELYREPGRNYSLTHGFVAAGGVLGVASKMQQAHIYIDGARTAYKFLFGAHVTIGVAASPLRLFVAERKTAG